MSNKHLQSNPVIYRSINTSTMSPLPLFRHGFLSSKVKTSSQTLLKKVSIPELPSAPFPVDYYHYHCCTSSERIVKDLVKALRVNYVDFELIQEKCKFKCVKYIQYGSIEFNVRLFATKNPGTTLVEFQRRAGNLLHWDELYAQLYTQMIDVIDRNSPASPQSGGQKKVFSASSSGKTKVQDFQDFTLTKMPTSGFDAILKMLQSKYVDAHCEATCTLASLTEDSFFAETALNTDMLDGLIHCLKLNQENSKVNRCVVSAVGNMTNSLSNSNDSNLKEESQSQLLQIAQYIIDIICARKMNNCLELYRECSRALKNLSLIYTTQLLHCTDVHNLRNHLTACHDERFSSNMLVVLDNLC